jgi:hypothetical protein
MPVLGGGPPYPVPGGAIPPRLLGLIPPPSAIPPATHTHSHIPSARNAAVLDLVLILALLPESFLDLS